MNTKDHMLTSHLLYEDFYPRRPFEQKLTFQEEYIHSKQHEIESFPEIKIQRMDSKDSFLVGDDLIDQFTSSQSLQLLKVTSSYTNNTHFNSFVSADSSSINTNRQVLAVEDFLNLPEGTG